VFSSIFFCIHVHLNGFRANIYEYVERCKHVKSQATTVYFRQGKLRRVSTYVHMCEV
jgi:hypothetical protein